MTKFNTLIHDARKFYSTLAENNNKDWWEENKKTYETTLKAPALDLLETVKPKLEEIAKLPVRPKLFRPHRDVRFSKDKTPYKTQLHMLWALQTTARQNPVFFFGIGLDYVSAGAGIMVLDKPVLEDWRKFADLDTARVLGIAETLKSKSYKFREPALKRVPPPFAKDHEASDLLRMKGVVASRDIGQPDDLVDAILQAFTDLAPLNALLLQAAEA